MAVDHGAPYKPKTQLITSAIYRFPARRRIPLRRRKLPSVRLGGKRNKGGLFLVRIMLKKLRLRWLKLQYLRMLKRLKEYYFGLIKDLIEAGATYEAYQQRILMETSCAVPVLGTSFISFPSMSGSDRPRSIFLM